MGLAEPPLHLMCLSTAWGLCVGPPVSSALTLRPQGSRPLVHIIAEDVGARAPAGHR